MFDDFEHNPADPGSYRTYEDLRARAALTPEESAADQADSVSPESKAALEHEIARRDLTPKQRGILEGEYASKFGGGTALNWIDDQAQNMFAEFAPKASAPPQNMFAEFATAPAAKPQAQEPRSLLKEVPLQLYAGATIDLPKQVGQAMQWMSEPGHPAYEKGQALQDWAAQREKESPDLAPQTEGRGLIGRALSAGARAIAPSVVPMVAGAALAPLGVAAAGTALAAGTFGLFGASQAQESYDKLIKSGVPEPDARRAGWINLMIEGGGETLGDVAGLKLFGLFGKALGKSAVDSAIKGVTDTAVWKPFITQLPKTTAIEASTEFGQNYGEAWVENRFGAANPEQNDPFAQGVQGAEAALGMTLLLGPFGLAGFASRAKRNGKIADALTDPDTPEANRIAAAKIVFDEIKAVDPKAAAAWSENSTVAILGKAPILLDETTAQSDQNLVRGMPVEPASADAITKDGLAKISAAPDLDTAIQAAADATKGPIVPAVIPIVPPKRETPPGMDTFGGLMEDKTPTNAEDEALKRLQIDQAHEERAAPTAMGSAMQAALTKQDERDVTGMTDKELDLAGRLTRSDARRAEIAGEQQRRQEVQGAKAVRGDTQQAGQGSEGGQPGLQFGAVEGGGNLQQPAQGPANVGGAPGGGTQTPRPDNVALNRALNAVIRRQPVAKDITPYLLNAGLATTRDDGTLKLTNAGFRARQQTSRAIAPAPAPGLAQQPGGQNGQRQEAPETEVLAPAPPPAAGAAAPVAAPTLADIHALAESKGIDVGTPEFRAWTRKSTGKEHLDALNPTKRKILFERLKARPAAAGTSPEWVAFPPESGTLGVPRADMPQIAAEHRGALVNFLEARGVTHHQEEVRADSLKPTQAEYSPAKVEKAQKFEGGDRSILVSSDNHIVDGHHQAIAAARAGEPINIIRLNAPIAQLLPLVREFPSATTAPAGTAAPAAKAAVAPAPQAKAEPSTETAVTAKQQLFVRWGGQTHPVESLQDASEKWEAFRDKAGAGVSEVGNGVSIVDQTGKEVARVSYNGRVWPAGEHKRGNVPLYVPEGEKGPAKVETPPTVPRETAAPAETKAAASKPETKPAAEPKASDILSMSSAEFDALIDEVVAERRAAAAEPAPTKAAIIPTRAGIVVQPLDEKGEPAGPAHQAGEKPVEAAPASREQLIADLKAKGFDGTIDRLNRGTITEAQARDELTGKPKPGEFKRGQRVEYVSGKYEGRHGEIAEAHAFRWSTGFGQVSESQMSYEVKTDNGGTVHASQAEIRAETAKPERVVADVKVGDRWTDPEHAYSMIGYYERGAAGDRAASSRAKKPDMKAKWLRNAEVKDADAARYRDAYNEWATRFPDEAAKIAPPVAAAQTAPTSVPSAAGAPSMTLTQTKHTKSGADLWVVKLGERVDAGTFSALKAKATRNHGIWSNFTKGFNFTTPAGAEAFMGKPATPAAGPSIERGDVARDFLAGGRGAVLPEQPTPQAPPLAGMTPLGAQPYAGTNWQPVGRNMSPGAAMSILTTGTRVRNHSGAEGTIQEWEKGDGDSVRVLFDGNKNVFLYDGRELDFDPRGAASPVKTAAQIASEAAAGRKVLEDLFGRKDSAQVAATPAVPVAASLDVVLTDEDKADAAQALGDKAWSDGTAKKFLQGYAEWLQQGAKELATALGKLYAKVLAAARAGLLSIAVAFNFNAAQHVPSLSMPVTQQTITQAVSWGEDKYAVREQRTPAGRFASRAKGDFDDEIWAKVRPALDANFAEFTATGGNPKDFVRQVFATYNESIIPYLRRWHKESAHAATGPGKPESPRPSPLEGVLPEEIPRLEGGGATGTGPRLGGGAHAPGDTGGPGGGLHPVPGVGEGAGTVPPAPGGGRPAGGTTGQSGLRQPGGNEPGTRPGELVPQAENFVITDELELGKGTSIQKYEDNVAAIRLLKQIEAENRDATPEEQKTLARYVGWGGIKEAFPNPNNPARKGWERRVAEIKDLLTEDEHDAAARSIQDAHYTSKPVVDIMWAIAGRLGFDGGKVLENSMGVGNFFGLMPAQLRTGATLTGIELDNITARIAKQLYPKANIIGPIGFEDVNLADNTFNLNVGNPPFGKGTPYDANSKHLNGFTTHNFFFAKAIDKLAPGGLHIQVVSRYLMDAQTNPAREYIAHRAELIGAMRLPWTAFYSTAGTEVVTDIIVLQKLEERDWGRADDSWTKTTMIPDPLGGEPMRVNQYYADHPEMIVGQMNRSGEMVMENDITVQPEDGIPLELGLMQRAMNFPDDIYRRGKSEADVKAESDAAVSAPAETIEQHAIGSYFEEGGRLLQRVMTPDGSLRAEEITAASIWKDVKPGVTTKKGELKTPSTWGETRIARVRGMVHIHEAEMTLLNAERNDAPDAELKALRAVLNKVYDKYVAEHGFLNQRENELAFRADSVGSPRLLALEHNFDAGVSKSAAKRLGIKEKAPTAEKMPIFTTRQVAPYKAPDKAANAIDGLAISIMEKGSVSVPYIAKLTGMGEHDIVRDLTSGEKPVAYFNPASKTYETAPMYLSGNVKRKYQEAREAGLMEQAEALKAAFPPDAKAGDIVARMGAGWIHRDVYAKFVRHLLGEEAVAEIIFLPATGGFAVSTHGGDEVMVGTKWGSPRRDAHDLISRILNNKDMAVYDTDSDGKREMNKAATEAAQEKAEQIREEFMDWVFKDSDQREALVSFYNENINTHVGREWDGDYLTLPGKVPDAIITLNRHQLNAVARWISTGKILLDHVVGSGKTYTIIAATMEMRRIGLLKKPMIVVPNHLVEQWAQAFYQLYPGANILAMRKADFTKQNRNKMLARVATGNWDAVIFSHSSFGFIANERGILVAAIRDQIAELQAAIDAARKTEGAKSRTAAQYQKSKEKMQQRMKALLDKPKDETLTFQQLGVDQITVDESQEFKNLFFTTQRRGVGGFGNPTGSKRAFDMYIKTQWLQKTQNGRGVAFATGTPISNSLTELFTLQRYLGLDELKARGMVSLDAWLAAFGITETDYESNVTGTKYKRKERLRRITNAPEIMQLYKQFTDSVTQADVERNYREDHEGKAFPIPKVKGGKARQNVTAKATAAQNAFSEQLNNRMDHLPSDPRIDNALKVLTDGRKASLDMRLIDPSQSDEPGSKIHVAADNIYRIYAENTHRLGTQLVFCDLSTPNKHGKKDAAKFLKEAREILDDKGAAPFGDLRQQWRELRSRIQEMYDTMDEAEGDQRSIDHIEKFLAQHDDIDAAVTNADLNFSIYDDMRTKLIERGIAPHEIAFIHDYNGDAQKQDLFDAVNAGRIRVLLGSTAKMGAGTNVQRRMVGLHHLDVPWRPSDILQREGRIVRQGNYFRYNPITREDNPGFEVEILAYATEPSSDVFMWQAQEQKLVAIESISRYHGEREIEDVSGESMSASEMKALASGNPLILEDVKLTEEIRKLEASRARHRSTEQDLESEVARYQRYIDQLPAVIARQQDLSNRIDAYKANPFEGKRPTAQIDGKEVNAEQAWEHIAEVRNAALMAAAEANAPARTQQKIIEEKTQAVKLNSPEFKALEAEHKAIEKALIKPKFEVTFAGKVYRGVESAQKAVTDKLGDHDAIRFVLDGKDYIRRADIEAHIDDVVRDWASNMEGSATLGTVGGIPIELAWINDRLGNGIKVTIGGEVEYAEHGTKKSFIGQPYEVKADGDMVLRLIQKILRETKSNLTGNKESYQKALKGIAPLKAQMGKPWGKDVDLAKKKARAADVRRELAGQAPPVLDATKPVGHTILGTPIYIGDIVRMKTETIDGTKVGGETFTVTGATWEGSKRNERYIQGQDTRNTTTSYSYHVENVAEVIPGDRPGVTQESADAAGMGPSRRAAAPAPMSDANLLKFRAIRMGEGFQLVPSFSDVQLAAAPGFDFFAHRRDDKNRTWNISERSTGLHFGAVGDTKKEAIAEAERIIGEVGVEKLQSAIDGAPKITPEILRRLVLGAGESGTAAQIQRSGLLNQPNESALLDPSKAEAAKVQAGIEGKTVLEAARFIAATGTGFQKIIAGKIVQAINRLQTAGVVFDLKLAHVGDTVPRALLPARGITAWNFAPNNNTVTVWINASDVTGKVGTSYETVLHELVHAATVAITHLGNRKAAIGYKSAQDVRDLYAVTNHVIAHFNARVAAAKAGKTTLTDFEDRLHRGASNAFTNPDETLAWALSNPQAQAYLETVPYPEHKSAWTAFVDAIRRLLGIPRHAATAFSEVLRISENLMGDNANELLGIASDQGSTEAQTRAGSGVLQQAKFIGKFPNIDSNPRTVSEMKARAAKHAAERATAGQDQTEAAREAAGIAKPASERGENYDQAWKEYSALPGVDADYLGRPKISDLVAGAQFELDIAGEGEIKHTPKQSARIRAFIEKWTGAEESQPASSQEQGGTLAHRSTASERVFETVQKAPVVGNWLSAQFNSPASFGILKPFNTQLHKALTLAKQGKPEFKRVFDKLQDFLSDTTALAVHAEQQAPTMFRELTGLGAKSVKNYLGAAKTEDINAIGPWLNYGTLYGGPSPMDGIVWTDKELAGDFAGSKRVKPRVPPLTLEQIKLYHEARAAINTSVETGAKSAIFKNVEKFGITFDKFDSLDRVAAEVKDQLTELRNDAHIRYQQQEDITNTAHEESQTAGDAAKARPKDRQLRVAAENARANYENEQKALDDIQKDIDTFDRLIGTKDEPGTIDQIGDVAHGLIEHGYAPLKRFGNRTVTAYDSTGKARFFGAFDGTPLVPGSANAEMQRVAVQIKALHPEWDVVTGVRDEEAWKMYQGLSLDALENFLDLLPAETQAEIKRDPIVQEYLKNSVNNRSVLKELIHRKGTPGFSTDVARVVASFMTSHARAASSLYHIGAAKNMVQDIPQEQGDVRDEAAKLVDYVTKPGEEAAKLRGFLFFHFLGASVAAGAVNLTQTPMMTVGYLNKFASLKDVTARILAASAKAVMDPIGIKGALGQALVRAEREGITAPQQIHHLIGISANNPFSSNRAFRGFMNVWGSIFGATEVFNRRVAFMAGYETGQANGMGDAAAYAFAKDVVAQTQGLYNRGNTANIGRGAIGKTVFTFKQFTVMYLELLQRLPPKQQLLMLGILLAAAGGEGLPFAEDIEDLVDTLGQWLGFSTNTGKWTGKVIRDTLGAEFERPLLKGLGGMLPIDLHSRLGFGNIVPGTAFLKPSEIDKTRDVAEAVGPLGGVLKSFSDSLQLLARGKWDQAAVNAAPKALRDAYNGLHMAATGESQDIQGRLALKDVTAGEALGKAIGFNPQRAAIESETKRELQLDKNLRIVRMDEMASDWADGILRQDRDKQAEARQRLRTWNSENPELRIQMADMLRSVQERVKAARMTGAERFIRSTPKALKPEARSALQ
jgi:N12 class adenine-specific DNA methylase/antitoxin (DNA-binding transcriptional repressor) of toxin-antitoxin stability system